MNKKSKKITVFLLSLLLLNIQIEPIKAIKVNENTGGTSSEFIEGVDCTIPHDGCHYWSENFAVEMALVDKRMVIVEGTKSVQFFPDNPYNNESYGLYDAPQTQVTGGGFFDSKTEQDIVILGMYTVNYGDNGGWTSMQNVDMSALQRKTSREMYQTYMGFGYEHEELDDFTTYEKHRNDFIRYINSLERKNRVVEGNFDGYVNFIDFFLRVSGYTDVWNYTEDYNRLQELIGKEYYIVIEPIYTVGTYYNGHNHTYRGTAKYLGNLLYNYPKVWANSNPRYNWFGLFNDFNEPRYNMLCNFYDKASYNNQTFRLNGGVYNETNTGDWTDPTTYIKDKEYICSNPNSIYNIGTREMSNLLGWIQSPFGVNIVSIKHDVITPPITTVSSNVNVNTCENDLFKYELNLTAANGDDKTLFNTIYPNKVESDKLDKFIYHVGENGNELWCYDNISYDFSALKEEVGNKTVSSGQLQNLPNGTLRVDRTCYSKVDETKLKGYLDQVFKTDAGTYQDTFTFNFNNQNYTYKRNTDRYTYKYNGKKYKHSNKSWYDKELVCEENSCRNNHYTYTSTFYYDYEIDNAPSNINSININDYSLNNSLENTNSIKFITQFDNAIVIKKQDEKIKTYNNTLSKPSNNAYGLSSKLYTELNNNSTKSDGDTIGTDIYSGSGSVSSGTNIVKFNYNETAKQSCELQTTVKDNDVDVLGKGVQFRVISLSNPFPARDGTTRLAGENWINKTENNVYDYIQNNRNIQSDKSEQVNPEMIYREKEPLYTLTLDTQSMIKIREYNKNHSYGEADITCEEGTGRKCVDNFIRKAYYVKELDGTCAIMDSKNTTNFYTCANKTEKSGG